MDLSVYRPRRTKACAGVGVRCQRSGGCLFSKEDSGPAGRLSIKEANWEASLGVERMELATAGGCVAVVPIGQGIVYGSSVPNYLISGKPVSELKVLIGGLFQCRVRRARCPKLEDG